MMWARFLWSVLYSGMWLRVPWYKFTEDTKEYTAPIFMVEENDSKKQEASMEELLIAWLILRSWRWWQVPRKCYWTSIRLHGVKFHKTNTSHSYHRENLKISQHSSSSRWTPGVLYNSLISWLVLTLHTPCSVTGPYTFLSTAILLSYNFQVAYAVCLRRKDQYSGRS
jgi:hypothetical protein